MLETTSADRKDWHKKEQTLTKLLQRAQSKEMLPITSKIFKVCGLPTNGKLSPKKFISEYCKYFVEKKGEKLPAYINKVTIWEKDENGKVKKDKDGNYIPKKDKDGNILYDFKLTAIKDGTWTLEKLLKSCTK
jgi:hypothetical protein